MLERKILKIAKTTRNVVEDFVKEVGTENPKTLECCCAIASYTLFFSLRHFRYNPTLVIGSYNDFYVTHCWVELNDKIIDLTETQFGSKKKVAIHNLNSLKYRERYEILSGNLDPSLFKFWPKSQRPVRKLTNKVLEKIK